MPIPFNFSIVQRSPITFDRVGPIFLQFLKFVCELRMSFWVVDFPIEIFQIISQTGCCAILHDNCFVAKIMKKVFNEFVCDLFYWKIFGRAFLKFIKLYKKFRGCKIFENFLSTGNNLKIIHKNHKRIEND